MENSHAFSVTAWWRPARHLVLVTICAVGLGGCATSEWLSFLNIDPADFATDPSADRPVEQRQFAVTDEVTAPRIPDTEVASITEIDTTETDTSEADRVAAISPAAGGHGATHAPIEDAPVERNRANRHDLTQNNLASMFLSFLMP
jgi:hypothetical protein